MYLPSALLHPILALRHGVSPAHSSMLIRSNVVVMNNGNSTRLLLGVRICKLQRILCFVQCTILLKYDLKIRCTTEIYAIVPYHLSMDRCIFP